MKVVVDVNFPPSLAAALSTAGVEAVHWTTQGEATAPDAEILEWARREGWVVLTQDLDFPDILAATGADAPSVLLVRDADALAPGLVDSSWRHFVSVPTLSRAARSWSSTPGAGASEFFLSSRPRNRLPALQLGCTTTLVGHRFFGPESAPDLWESRRWIRRR